MSFNNTLRVNTGSKLIGSVIKAGCFLNGSLPPAQEALNNKDVANATEYTTYYQTGGNLWQKRNGVWFQFGTAGGGGQTYDIEPNRPTPSDLRPEGSFWYFKNLPTGDISEVYVCLKNDGATCDWGLLENYAKMIKSAEVAESVDPNVFDYSFDLRVSGGPVSGTHTKKNNYQSNIDFPMASFRLDSTLNATQDFREGSEITTNYGAWKMVRPTPNQTIWDSSMLMGYAWANCDSQQGSNMTTESVGRQFTYQLIMGENNLPDGQVYKVDNFNNTVDPEDGTNNGNEGFVSGSIWQNQSSDTIFMYDGDDKWVRIYSKPTENTYFNGNLLPSIQDDFQGNTSWVEPNFGIGPTFDLSTLTNNFQIVNNNDIRYIGLPDVVVNITFNATINNASPNGWFEYGLFRNNVDPTGTFLIKNSPNILGVGTGGIGALASSSSKSRIVLESGDTIKFGRRAVSPTPADTTFVLPLIFNITIEEVK